MLHLLTFAATWNAALKLMLARQVGGPKRQDYEDAWSGVTAPHLTSPNPIPYSAYKFGCQTVVRETRAASDPQMFW
jgi:hypothetical protein